MTPSNIPHIGHHLGLKIRQRRKQLGLSQRQVADSIGVTYQQVQKYERGVDRIPSDRLYGIARTLAADVGYFFEGLGEADTARPIGHGHLCLEVSRNFANIEDETHQRLVVQLCRSLAA
jgi:transcriptional regulator with XRE-family HTH domain